MGSCADAESRGSFDVVPGAVVERTPSEMNRVRCLGVSRVVPFVVPLALGSLANGGPEIDTRGGCGSAEGKPRPRAACASAKVTGSGTGGRFVWTSGSSAGGGGRSLFSIRVDRGEYWVSVWTGRSSWSSRFAIAVDLRNGRIIWVVRVTVCVVVIWRYSWSG